MSVKDDKKVRILVENMTDKEFIKNFLWSEHSNPNKPRSLHKRPKS